MGGRTIRPLLLLLAAGIGVGVAVAASAATQSSGGTVRVVDSAKFGRVLVGPSGKTLYRYTLDRKGVNRCSPDATCAKYWPRLLGKPGVKPNAGTGVNAQLLGTIKQPKGLVQISYAGFPLYYFVGDAKAGDMKGEGFDNTWYLVDPSGRLIKHAVAGSNAAAPATTVTETTNPYYP